MPGMTCWSGWWTRSGVGGAESRYNRNEVISYAFRRFLSLPMFTCPLCDLFVFCCGDVLLDRALEDPRNSMPLRKFVRDAYQSEAASLLQEHNSVVQMYQQQISRLKEDIQRINQERMEMIDSHSAEITALHAKHASETQAICHEFTEKSKAADA